MKKNLFFSCLVCLIFIAVFIFQQNTINFNNEQVLSWLKVKNMSFDSSTEVIPPNPKSFFSTYDTFTNAVDNVHRGKYMTEGIPLDMYLFYKRWLVDDNELDNILNEETNSSTFKSKAHSVDGFSLNYSKGIKVLNANCFKCHSSQINGNLVYGLGNVYSNYQKSKRIEASLLTIYKNWLASDSDKIAMGNFNNLYENIAKNTSTSNPIVNPAFRLEESCMQNLNPRDLKFTSTANFQIDPNTLASDTPPLWNIRFKDALYFNGMGRGSFEKLILQITMFGNPDTLSLRKSIGLFKIILNWASKNNPPIYPKKVNQKMVYNGQVIYNRICSNCHGKPINLNNKIWSYKTQLVSIDEVKTDPFYAIYFVIKSNLPAWYNNSWFSKSTPNSNLYPKLAYVAPPLAGIWATAPYLHNGSIPDLRSLLKSYNRPKFWKMEYNSKKNYDLNSVGLIYKVHLEKRDLMVFDTTIPGYWNTGHNYSDHLSNKELDELLEYLKTL